MTKREFHESPLKIINYRRMKKIFNISILFALVAVFILNSCEKKAPQTTVIKGKIVFDYESDYFFLGAEDRGEPFDTIQLNEDKTFEITIPVTKFHERYLTLTGRNGGVRLFVSPGREINVMLNQRKVEEVTGSPESNYYLSSPPYRRSGSSTPPLPPTPLENQENFENAYKDKMHRLDSVVALYPDFNKELEKKIRIEEYYWRINHNIIYYDGTVRTRARFNHPPLTNAEREDYKKILEDYVKQIDFNNEEHFSYYPYQRILYTLFREKAKLIIEDAAPDNKLSFIKTRFEEIKKLIPNQNIKEFAMYKAIVNDVTKEESIYMDELRELFLAEVKNPEYIEEVIAKIEATKKLGKGADAPEFSYKDVNGKTVSLSDLRGKYVYIDVWATWCGPCKAEIPHLKELEKDLHGKDIQFVSISIDKPKDKEKWEKMVADMELTGIQLFNGNDPKFATDYMVKGIPHFILIDKEGKMVKNKCYRPSAKITKDWLLKEIEK